MKAKCPKCHDKGKRFTGGYCSCVVGQRWRAHIDNAFKYKDASDELDMKDLRCVSVEIGEGVARVLKENMSNE